MYASIQGRQAVRGGGSGDLTVNSRARSGDRHEQEERSTGRPTVKDLARSGDRREQGQGGENSSERIPIPHPLNAPGWLDPVSATRKSVGMARGV